MLSTQATLEQESKLKSKIYFQTYGCSLNQSDSEMMAGLLSIAGHEIVDSIESADLVVFNTCTVKDSPEKSFFSLMNKVLSEGKKVVVAGCVSQADPRNPGLANVSIIGVRHLELITEVVDATLTGRVVKLLNFKKNPRLNLPKIRKNPLVEILPINSGCLGDCTFCKTRFARGVLYSYDPIEIKAQMQEAVDEGCREIWLTSQDSGAYGRDIGTDLVALLDELVKVRGDYRIRIGMLNPDLALDMVPGLIRFLNHPKAFKFIHIPIQSGSDKILTLMRRRYSGEQFMNLVKAFREGVPNVTIATDIIAGFPGETEEDHEDTMRVMKELNMPVINVTKFFPRAGTLAAKMKLLPTDVVKKRSTELMNLYSQISNNEEWIGWSGRILINEIGKNNSFVGRNDWYKPIIVRGEEIKLGDTLNVKITKCHQHYLEAEVIK
jgi:threonylcarbamoyladenosine tRNA methylthiotransferase CDKAL1